MKARVKATGETIEVQEVTKYSSNYAPSTVYEDVIDGVIYKKEFLDFENLTEGLTDVKEKSLPKDEPDYWTKLHHQAAIAAMQGVMTNIVGFESVRIQRNASEVAAEIAIDYATTLINKLKEEQKCEK